MTTKNIIIALLLAVVMAGCSLKPDYVRPNAPVPSEFAYSVNGKAGDNVSEIAWREFFLSPELQRLIETALDNNRNLRVAALNIESAAALYRIQRSNLIPNIDATGAFTRQRVPRNANGGQSVTNSSSSVGVGVTSYELDLFGRVRDLKEKALESFFATEEAKNVTQISLIAETANAYITYLGDKELLTLADETLVTRQKSYDLVKRKFDAGSASRLDLEQALSSLETARVSQITYTRLIAQDLNALSLLTGTEIKAESLKGKLSDNSVTLKELPGGVNSEALLQRPDIKRAEHLLKGANADIGAARAAFFPSITLTASAGLASNGLDDLFKSGSAMAWSFSPRINIPIFYAGRNMANLESAKVSQKIAAAQYEEAIQTAFRETADQLAARATYSEQLKAQQSLETSSLKVYELSAKRYEYGISDYLQVLDAQRTLFSAQEGVINVKRQYLNNLVTLYKVLGGGQI